MRNIAKEVISGVAILVAFVIFVFGFLYLKNVTFKAGTYTILIHFEDVTGLEPGDKISLSGLQIGKVRGFELENLEVLVDAELNPEVLLPRDSRAYIRSMGMVGEKFIDVVPGNAPDLLREGDRIDGHITGDLTAITDSAEDLMKQAKELLSKLNAAFANVFDTASQNRLKESIDHLNQISDTINKNTSHLENTLINIESMSKNLNEIILARRDQVETSIENFHDVSGRFTEMATQMDKSLTSIQSLLDKIENQEGTVGKVLADDELYTDIRTLTTELETLVQDFKARPQKYVNFGFIKVF